MKLTARHGIVPLLAALALGVSGCAFFPQTTVSEPPAFENPAPQSSAADLAVPGSVAEAMAANATPIDAGADLAVSGSPVQITLSDAGSSAGEGVNVAGSQITISQPGSYRVTGSLSDGQLSVDVASKGLVQIILDGVSITNSKSAAVVLSGADRVALILEGESQLTDAETYVYPDSATTEPDAALFSFVDLVIGGSGKLTVNGRAGDGITGKDGLVIAGGTLNVTAADDAIKGRDYLAITGGDITANGGGDGLKASNDSDETAGYLLMSGGSVKAAAATDCIDAVTDVLITGGALELSCGDDGIHSDQLLMVEDGQINITKSYEGIESAVIVIAGGQLDITADDDGINASNGNSTDSDGFQDRDWSDGGDDTWGRGGMDPENMPTAMPQRGGRGGRGGGGFGGESVQAATLVITGGKITITAGGDGIDSNGTGSMTGGEVVINVANRGMEGPIDVIGEWTVTGGTITDPEGNPIQ
ncbi:MAG: carbohydrate-binding domain-containing protein [Propionibacteriaceae bacterium]|nr:carbohydrate-binding domain-containing protein [Propionibacteriaceae bacterium]